MWFQKMSIPPPPEGIGNLEIPGGGAQRPKLRKCMKLNWNFQRGGWGILGKILYGGYGYFLKPHISDVSNP